MEIELLHDTLDAINGRCRRVMDSVGQALPPIPEQVRARLPRSAPKYCFGFRPFMLSASSCAVIGLFLAALEPNKPKPETETRDIYDSLAGEKPPDTPLARWYAAHHFFAVIIGRPGNDRGPRPFEYQRGDEFDYHRDDVPVLEDLSRLSKMSDAETVDWLAKHCSALVEYVIRAAEGITIV